MKYSTGETVQSGDIIQSIDRKDKSKVWHPAIFLMDSGPHEFLGVMVTTSDEAKYKNIPLPEKYFKKKLPKEDNLIVDNMYLKKKEWAPFKKVGELTPEGVEYVLSCLKDCAPIKSNINVNSK